MNESSVAIIKGWVGDSALKENWGFKHPALTRQELAEIAMNLADKIREYSSNEVSETVERSVANAAQKIRHLIPDTIWFVGIVWMCA